MGDIIDFRKAGLRKVVIEEGITFAPERLGIYWLTGVYADGGLAQLGDHFEDYDAALAASGTYGVPVVDQTAEGAERDFGGAA